MKWFSCWPVNNHRILAFLCQIPILPPTKWSWDLVVHVLQIIMLAYLYVCICMYVCVCIYMYVHAYEHSRSVFELTSLYLMQMILCPVVHVFQIILLTIFVRTCVCVSVRKRWRATACCGKSKFAISSGWLKKGSVSHPDDIITLP